MAQSFIRNMLGRQNRRALAIIMNHAERSFWDQLTEDQRTEFRTVVLGAVSSYHQAAVDMVESSVETGMVINQEAVKAIVELNERMQRTSDERLLTGTGG